MPKLAIYIPKKEMRQIERWRKKINFSRVFMKALLSEIHERERVDRSGNNKRQIASAAAFYKEKLMQEGADVLVDHGYTLGHQDVLDCNLAPELIRRILQLRQSESLDLGQAGIIRGAIGKKMGGVDEFAVQHGFDEQSRPSWEQAVFRGYIKGVVAAWQRVCEEMNSTIANKRT